MNRKIVAEGSKKYRTEELVSAFASCVALVTAPALAWCWLWL